MSHPLLREFRSEATGEALLFFAVRWKKEAPSKRAWEEAMKVADNTHVWRIQTPHKGPPVDWSVVGMAGQTHRPGIVASLREVERVGGYTEWVPDGEFLEALALRRARMIIERTAKKDFGLKVIRDRPRRMDRTGTMTDYDPDA